MFWKVHCLREGLLLAVVRSSIPLLLLLPLSKNSAICVHQLFCLNSTILSEALDDFHLSICYYAGAHPLRV